MHLNKSKNIVSILQKPLFVVSAIFIAIISISAILTTISKQKQMEIEHTIESLQTMASSTEMTLEKVWYEDIIANLTNDLAKESIKTEIIELLNTKSTKKELLGNPSQEKIRKQFLKLYSHNQIQGIFLINPDYISLASLSDENIGTPNFIAKYYSERLEKVFKGSTQFIPPIPSDRKVGKKQSDRPTMFFALPVFDDKKNVIAAFTVRFDPSGLMSKIAQNAQLGESGETYLFNREGKILTQSRFVQHLVKTGLSDSEDSILAIDVRDPGVNLLTQEKKQPQSKEWPFTYGVQKCLNGDMQPYYNAYRDYRGVKVFGAWKWNETLGIGIISEIDETEALDSHYIISKLIMVETTIVVFLFVLFIYIIYITSRDALKNTQETSNYLNTVVDNSLNAIITINKFGIVNSYNKAAQKLFGYEPNEVLGKNVSILVPSPHKEKHDSYINNFLVTGEKKIIDSSREVEAKSKDGKTIYLELGLTEAFHNNETFFIASIHDITDSKIFEEELKTQQRILKEAQRIGRLGYWRWNITDNMGYCSDTMYNIMGMEPIDGFIPFKDIFSSVHPEDEQRITESFNHSIETIKYL